MASTTLYAIITVCIKHQQQLRIAILTFINLNIFNYSRVGNKWVKFNLLPDSALWGPDLLLYDIKKENT